jgi:hypothetical protein
MADVLHGYIQLAKRTAEQAPYQIKPANWGYRVWRMRPSVTVAGQFPTMEEAEDWICMKIAILGE